jgi:hypothetical protein
VTGITDYDLLDPRTGQERPLVENPDVNRRMGDLVPSPDGSQVVVYTTGGELGRGMWILSLEDGSRQRIAEGRFHPDGWTQDGQGIYAGSADGYHIYPLSGGERKPVDPLEGRGRWGCRPTERPVGFFWVCLQTTSISDVWMIENFDPGFGH